MTSLYDDPSFHVPQDWSKVPVQTQTALTDLGHQFDLLTGGTTPLSNELLAAAAVAGVSDLFQLGQFIQGQGSNYGAAPNLFEYHPGAAYGISDDQYKQQVAAMSISYQKDTGQMPDIADVQDALRSQLTPSEWSQQIKNDPHSTETYGWLKMGMDYQQFQDQKSVLHTSFGHSMDNNEALKVMQQQHEDQSARGGTREVTMQPQTAFQPVKQADPLSEASVR